MATSRRCSVLTSRSSEGETVAVIGANGAGKTTFLRSVAGALPVARESVVFDGEPIGGRSAHDMVWLGIAMVPEGRRLFPSLTVEENLLLGGHTKRAGTWNLKRVYDLFPRLYDLRHMPAPTLSGGQQQMVAIGRGLMSNPRLLLCDELSLGLAPVVIRDIYAMPSPLSLPSAPRSFSWNRTSTGRLTLRHGFIASSKVDWR